MFENRVLRKIFGPKRNEVTAEWRELPDGELRNLYSSPDIIRQIKSRRMSRRGMWHEWKRAEKCRWEDGIRMDLLGE
jgi:hypothetical protein